MVVGIDKFREHFAGHEEQYALIGGAACELIFADAGLEFRATKDLDVVLCIEANDLRSFLDGVRDDESFDPKAFKVQLSRAEGVSLLEDVYGL